MTHDITHSVASLATDFHRSFARWHPLTIFFKILLFLFYCMFTVNSSELQLVNVSNICVREQLTKIFRFSVKLHVSRITCPSCSFLFFSPNNTGSIHVVLHEDSTAKDHLQSCFQACVLDYVIRTRPNVRKVTNHQLSYNLPSVKSLWYQKFCSVVILVPSTVFLFLSEVGLILRKYFPCLLVRTMASH